MAITTTTDIMRAAITPPVIVEVDLVEDSVGLGVSSLDPPQSRMSANYNLYNKTCILQHLPAHSLIITSTVSLVIIMWSFSLTLVN